MKTCALTYLLILEMVILLKIKSREFFSTRQHSYFGVTHYENWKVQKGRKEIFGDRPPATYLKVWMTAPPRPPPPPPTPPYLKVWVRHCTDWSLTRVVFKLGSKVNCVCYGFATPHGDWLFDKTRAIFSAKEK